MFESESTTVRIELPQQLGVGSARELFALLAPHVAEARPVAIDAPVARVDASSVQILLAFVRARTDAGRRTGWLQVSDVLRNGATSLGLTDALGVK